MTGHPLRPEEERSLVEPHPEVTVPPVPMSPMDVATRLVTKWENGLAMRIRSLEAGPAHLVLTNDVRDQLRDDIAAAINDAISREHNVP